jgi:cytochrome c oxidase accessory protein FixG
LGITASTYVFAGFAREQICTYMCPYARFQSAMFDDNTLIISYDEKRGEPRQKWDGDVNKTSSHCIDCKQCVVVCPTGIDIRNGLQMECIACGLCIDACDNVMEKIGLPKGLIRYDTLANLSDPRPEKKFKALRPRSFFYTAILTLICVLMLKALLFKKPIETSVIPNRNPLFVMLSNGDIRNDYELKILNKTHQKKTFTLAINHPNEARLKLQNEGSPAFEVEAGVGKSFKISIIFPKETLAQSDEKRALVQLFLTDLADKKTQKISAVFVGK